LINEQSDQSLGGVGSADIDQGAKIFGSSLLDHQRSELLGGHVVAGLDQSA
jgi:hypothetical protein